MNRPTARTPPRDPNDRQQTASSSLSDADLWGKIRAKPGHGDTFWLRTIMALQPFSILRTALRWRAGEGWGERHASYSATGPQRDSTGLRRRARRVLREDHTAAPGYRGVAAPARAWTIRTGIPRQRHRWRCVAEFDDRGPQGPLGIASVGHRRRLLEAIAALREGDEPTRPTAVADAAPSGWSWPVIAAHGREKLSRMSS